MLGFWLMLHVQSLPVGRVYNNSTASPFLYIRASSLKKKVCLGYETKLLKVEWASTPLLLLPGSLCKCQTYAYNKPVWKSLLLDKNTTTKLLLPFNDYY